MGSFDVNITLPLTTSLTIHQVDFSYDSSYQAVLNKATELGYTLPSVPAQRVQNTLVSALKANSLWTEIDTLYLMTSGSSNFSTLNFKDPNNFQLTLVNSPTWTSGNGFKGDGATSYMDTGFKPATAPSPQYTLNSAARMAWIKTAPNVGTLLDGVAGSANNRMTSSSTVGQRINQGNANVSNSVDLSGAGMVAIYRTDSTTVNCYKDTTLTAGTATSTSVISDTQVIGRSASNYSNAEFAIYGMGSGALNASHATLYSIFSTYVASV